MSQIHHAVPLHMLFTLLRMSSQLLYALKMSIHSSISTLVFSFLHEVFLGEVFHPQTPTHFFFVPFLDSIFIFTYQSPLLHCEFLQYKISIFFIFVFPTLWLSLLCVAIMNVSAILHKRKKFMKGISELIVCQQVGNLLVELSPS